MCCVVAEDNLVNQKLLIQLLKRLNYSADIANDGVEAVSACTMKSYDVIVHISPLSPFVLSPVFLNQCTPFIT